MKQIAVLLIAVMILSEQGFSLRPPSANWCGNSFVPSEASEITKARNAILKSMWSLYLLHLLFQNACASGVIDLKKYGIEKFERDSYPEIKKLLSKIEEQISAIEAMRIYFTSLDHNDREIEHFIILIREIYHNGGLNSIKYLFSHINNSLPRQIAAIKSKNEQPRKTLINLLKSLNYCSLENITSKNFEIFIPILGIRPHYKTLDVYNHVKEITEAYKYSADSKNLTLNVNMPSEKLLLENVDIHLFNTLLINLLNNAFQCTEKGVISISLSKQNLKFEHLGCAREYLTIEIKDTGMGIPPDEIYKIFDNGFRTSNSIKSNLKGTGLGLAIVSAIIHYMRGDIDVKSEIDKGTKFTLYIPIIFFNEEIGNTTQTSL